MIIERLIINNLRSYAGKHEVSFSAPGKKNVTLFHGNNGAGKTSLFNVLNWVLFGKAFSFDGHLINVPALRRSDIGSRVGGSGSIEFTHEAIHYYLTRGVEAYVDSDNEVREDYLPPTLHTIDESGNAESQRSVEEILEKLLPSPIRTFFFFDGDRISDFTRPGKSTDEAITRAVNHLLNLENIRRGINHLKSIIRDLNAELKRKNSHPRIMELQTNLESVEKRLEAALGRRIQLKLDMESLVARKELNRTQLESFREIREQAARRESLERTLRSLHAQIAELNAELIRMVARSTFVPLTNNKLAAAKSFLDAKRKKREVPSNIRDQFLKDLIAQKVCICNRTIETGSEVEIHLRALLKDTLPGAVQDRAQTLAATLGRLAKSREEAVARIVELIGKLHDLTKERDEVQSEISKIGDQIRGNYAAEIRQLEADREIIAAENTQTAIGVNRNEIELEALERERRELQTELNRETQKISALKGLSRRATLAEQAEEALVRIQERLEEGLRDDISSETTRIFSALIDKKGFFESVRVADDYLISVLNKDHENVRPVMSMGETQILSLSFILAMTAVSEYKAPLVIDTPLARLDNMVRQNVVRNLPSLTTQLSLLATNSEMTDDLRRTIAPAIGKEYWLEFADGATNIREEK